MAMAPITRLRSRIGTPMKATFWPSPHSPRLQSAKAGSRVTFSTTTGISVTTIWPDHFLGQRVEIAPRPVRVERGRHHRLRLAGGIQHGNDAVRHVQEAVQHL